MCCHISATWPKLHSQQLPRGVQHAKSAGMYGQGPFSNKKNCRNVIRTFFFCRDENQNWAKLEGRKSYLNKN